jgi:hypothetical protein
LETVVQYPFHHAGLLALETLESLFAASSYLAVEEQQEQEPLMAWKLVAKLLLLALNRVKHQEQLPALALFLI